MPMNRNATHAGQAALALSLAAHGVATQRSVSNSDGMPAGRLPLIGAGTFLVAAYLNSNFRPDVPHRRLP
jgi:hypothetical protein